jgi:hypothetical protein
MAFALFEWGTSPTLNAQVLNLCHFPTPAPNKTHSVMPQPKLDLRQHFRFPQTINSKPLPPMNFSPLPHLNPVIPQKTVDESDSSTIKCG